MSLPRVLWLAKDDTLRMSPPEELKMLRYNPKKMKNLPVKVDSELPLDDIRGNSIEISIEMVTKGAQQFGVKVCASPDGQEETLVYFDMNDMKLNMSSGTQLCLVILPKLRAGAMCLSLQSDCFSLNCLDSFT